MIEQNRVQWVYLAKDNAELSDRYDQWAKDYDLDLGRDFGWLGHQRASEVFARHVSTDARVLDAGAGTGLVGQVLATMGFQDLEAMDFSRGMLDEAAKKGVYNEFHQMVMGEPLDFATGSFDAVVSVGVLTVGHAPASSLDELVRITRAGGYIVFTLRPDVYRDSGFKEKQAALAAAGKWRLAEVSEEFQPLPKGEPEVYHQVWVYQITNG